MMAPHDPAASVPPAIPELPPGSNQKSLVSARFPAGWPRFWLIALSGLACGFLCSSGIVYAGFARLGTSLVPYLPGLGFGLFLSAWFLWAGWMRAAFLPVLLLGSTAAYHAAFRSTQFLYGYLAAALEKLVPGPGSGSLSLCVAVAGLLGGAVGTSMLTGVLALVSARGRETQLWHFLLLVGSLAGAGVVLIPAASYERWAFTCFISLWQFVVATALGYWLGRDLDGRRPAPTTEARLPWAKWLSWAVWLTWAGIQVVRLVQFAARPSA